MMFRRRREFKTNYRRRKKTLMSKMPFVYIFTSNKNVWAQVIRPAVEGDMVIAHASSKDLERSGWAFSRKNYPAHYLVGLLLGKRALKAGVEEVIYYSGLKRFVPRSRVAALLKGMLDAGVKVRVDEEVLPDEDAISGARIVSYYKALRSSGYAGPQFSKLGASVEGLQKAFYEMKERIMRGEVS